MELIYEKSRPGRRAGRVPTYDLPVPEIPAELRREAPPRLPEVPENEIVRHFTALADRNFGIDTGFYPLGSCTMKHNPESTNASWPSPGSAISTAPGGRGAQGALELMWELQQILAEIAGSRPSRCSRGGLAGRAHGADAHARGVRRSRRAREERDHHGGHGARHEPGERHHGRIRARQGRDDRPRQPGPRGPPSEGRRPDGGPDADEPSTLGLFDEGIEEVARIFHDRGALLYYDGANLNAVVGRSRPGDMGFDIVHYNLHKTFSQPHGGGGRAVVRLRCGQRSSRSFRRRSSSATATASVSTTTGRSRSVGCAGSRAVRGLRPLVRVHAGLRHGAEGHVRCRRPERELPSRAAQGRLRPPYDRSACTSSCSRRARSSASTDHGPRRRKAADGPRDPSADDLLPARVPER